MTQLDETIVGSVDAIWRYPVKSLLGESVNASEVTSRGVAGDRLYALADIETGKIASAKDPRRWPMLFQFRARLVGEADRSGTLPVAEITLPDGDRVRTDHAGIESQLSKAVDRPVRLTTAAAERGAVAEGYWPPYGWLEHSGQTFEYALPEGTFFDGASVHLLTTSTLEHLRQWAANSQFEVARFRPNLVIRPTNGAVGFVEDGWVGRTLAIGQLLLHVDRHCPRCVMTTLPQGDLPKDPEVLRTAVLHNRGGIGIYVSVVRPGRVRRGDAVRLV